MPRRRCACRRCPLRSSSHHRCVCIQAARARGPWLVPRLVGRPRQSRVHRPRCRGWTGPAAQPGSPSCRASSAPAPPVPPRSLWKEGAALRGGWRSRHGPRSSARRHRPPRTPLRTAGRPPVPAAPPPARASPAALSIVLATLGHPPGQVPPAAGPTDPDDPADPAAPD